MKRTSVILFLLSFTPCIAQTPVIYGDDCASDWDCALTDLPTLFKLADQGVIDIRAMTTSSANNLSAPAFKVLATYYNRSSMLIGAFQGSLSCSNGCNNSTWLSSLISQYDPGDTRANYQDCVTVDRTVLAAAATNSVVIIENGFWTCLEALLTSPGDSISPLTGAQLIQQKVKEFDVCCGVNPSGTEFNYQADPSDTAAWFSTVTSQNGYPPVWMIGFGNGSGTNAGPPHYGITTVNPSYFVANQSGINQRPLWGDLQILHAASGLVFRGLTTLSDAGNGTQTVNASTGANSWSTGTASGHHYLNNVASAGTLSNVFDGFAYGFGFAALPPGANTGSFVHGGVTINGGVLAQ